MILDLTAAPGEVTAADEGSVMGEARALNGHAEGTSEEPAQGDIQGQGFTFMQASEIEPPQVQDENNNASSSSPWNQEPAAPLVQAPTEEAMQHLEGGAAAESWGSPAGPVDAAVSSWADDVEEASQPVVAPPPTAAATGQGAAPEKSSSRGLRRGGGGQREGRGRGRGGSRGGPRASKAQIVGEGDGWVQVSHEQQSNTPNRGRGNRGRGQRGRSGGQARAGAHQTAST